MRNAAQESMRREENEMPDFTPTIHGLLLAGEAQDLTYRNDVCPSIGFQLDNGAFEGRLWVDLSAPHAEMDHRFVVTSGSSDGELVEHYAGDDEEEAVAEYLTLLTRNVTTVLAPCDCRKCNGKVPAGLVSNH